jgi:putative transposase
MPRKRQPQPTDIPDAVLDYFAGPARVMTPGEVDASMRRDKKALLERALGAELTHHLGDPPGAKPETGTNHRNGTTPQTVLTDEGAVNLDVPRDRAGTFEPVLIPKHERRLTGFDDKILALYARGMTVREIQAFLHERYAVEVSPDLISTVTDAIVDEVTTWQARPLDRVDAVVFDARRVKIRDEGMVRRIILDFFPS